MFALVDCNNFYASCERVFQPHLEQRPVVVLSNNDGCIIARSKEAKDLGIKMAVPVYQVQDLIKQHNIAVFSSNYTLYGDMSARVMNTLAELAPAVEVYSIDEAFLDLHEIPYNELHDFAANLRKIVRKWTKIPVSVGIAPTKTLAKAANRIAKKHKDANGVYMIGDEETRIAALKGFAVEDVWGIGRRYSKLMQSEGIVSAYDLTLRSDAWLRKHLNITGLRMVDELRGFPRRGIEEAHDRKKAICTSRSFGNMIKELTVIEEAIATHAARCAEKLRKEQSAASLVTVMIRSNRHRQDLAQYNNSITLSLPQATNDTQTIIRHAMMGLKSIFKQGYQYKKAGVVVSGIVPQDQVQGTLFDQTNTEKLSKVSALMDKLNNSFGQDTLKFAVQGTEKRWKLRQENVTPCYTTKWEDIFKVKVG